jgi:alpha-glucosidase (family GH31 glycosyl hydrolase)
MQLQRIVWRVVLGLVASLPALCAAASPVTSTMTLGAGNARFEFLTPTLVRMEYSPSGIFTDAPTAVIEKRDWPHVPVLSSEQDGWLLASSSAVTVRYRLKSGAFTAANLKVSWKDGAVTHEWHPGDVDAENLGGLTYSLDNISKANLPAGHDDRDSPGNDMIPGINVLLKQALPGLLSRSGYAFIDDSPTPVWNAQHTWIEPRPQQHGQDWYLFTYNRDYHQVLDEYAQLCGPIPMIPRYVLGPWVTDFNFEYFPGTPESAQPQFRGYNQARLTAELSRLRRNQIPFDTLVLDFAWHNYGWDGGYDFSPLFPHPDALMRWLHAQGIKLSLNDHPGYANTDESSLSFSDSHAAAALAALGRPPVPKPSLDVDLSRGWRIAADPHDQGLTQHWYAARDGAQWRPVRTDMPWQSQGLGAYQGVAWYRAAVRLPEKLPKALYLWLGEVKDSYRLFINGQEATHSTVRWPQRLTYADIAPYARAGENDIVLRVVAAQKTSGLLRGPVAIRDVAPPERIFFDLSNRKQADIFMRDLHGALMDQGVDVWWVDGGSGAVDMPGLNKQLWTNKVYYDFSQEHTGKRAFILGRYGDWGSERYPGYFTGDAYSEWPVLAYEVAYAVRGGNVLVPYISHDIGGFHGAKIDFALYARWIEFGAFSGVLRMHSAHANPQEGNMRMPWLYGQQGLDLMKKYFTLRTQLIPYLYTYAWRAHTDSIPLLRPLYLTYPQLEEAYRHAHEYLLGEEMLVAPILDPSGDARIYLPPGEWLDFFTGRHFAGGTTIQAHYALDETPVFVRAGAIIPEQPVSEYSDAKPADRLILNVFGAGAGSFELYEDDGASLKYTQRQQGLTSMSHAVSPDGMHRLIIGPTRGTFDGQPTARVYELHVHASSKPASVSVNGKDAGGFSWDAQRQLAVVVLPATPIRDQLSVDWR